MSEPTSHSTLTQCENCGSALQGHYCHVCGQRVHNPLKHFGHALEEVFESLWHLDGRIFRTLRDLMVPGRVAARYLAGHRVRYVAPMRLFLILTLLTFFIAHFTITIERPNVSLGDDVIANSDFGVATSAAEVEKIRAGLLAELRRERKQAEGALLSDLVFDAAEVEIERLAQARLGELRSGASASAAKHASSAAEGAQPPGRTHEASGLNIRFGDERWDPRKDSANLPFLPDFANAWLTAQARRGAANAERINRDPEAFKDAWLRAVPTMLFLLLPVFALLLRLLYWFAPRSYLEHLVVALYSHAWLMLALLLLFVAYAWLDAASNDALRSAIGALIGLVWLCMPIYLLWMQKRVYGQGWPLTLIKYFLLGILYLILLTVAVMFAMMIGVVRM